MKIDLQSIQGYDHVATKPGNDDAPAKFFFKGTRPFVYQLSSKIRQANVNSDDELNIQMDMKEMFNSFVEIMVGWENIFDSNSGLKITFSKSMARKLVENFSIFSAEEIINIVLTVWKTVATREEILKNLPDGSIKQGDSSPDGLTNVSHTDSIQSQAVRPARRKPVNN
jgi:hypothetical protein